MKKYKKLISFLLAITTLSIGFTACGAENADRTDKGDSEINQGNNEISVSLKVQCDTVARYECNGFILTAENLAYDAVIEYQLAAEGGEYVAVKQTDSRLVAYRCLEVGSYSVRASVEVDGSDYVTNACAFTVVEDGGETFGYSPTGQAPTHNVDLTNDYGEYPYIEHKSVGKSSDEYAFYKGVETEKFVFTATIDILGNNFNDQYPKTGLFAKVGKNIYYLAFDATPTGNGNTLVFAVYDASKSAWQWSSGISVNAPFRGADGYRISHSLTLLRDDSTFYFAVDGVYVGKRTVSGLSGKSVVGTYTMAQNALYTDYSCFVGGSAEFTSALATAKAAV